MTRTGIRLRVFASRWFSERTMVHVVDPVLADLQAEYEQAVNDGEIWRSRWIRAAGHAALVKAVLCYGAIATLRIFGDATDDGRALRRMLGCSLVSAGLISVALVVPVVRDVVPPHSDPGSLSLLLLPSVVPLSLPAGLMLGVLWGLGRIRSSWRPPAVMLLVAAASSAASFVALAWITPQTNQAFRVSVLHAKLPRGALLSPRLPKGANELTIGELRQFVVHGRPIAEGPPHSGVRSLAIAYHDRWAIAASPVVLAMFALAVSDRGWRRWLAMALASGGAVACYLVLGNFLRTALGEAAPPAAVAWTPNLVLLCASFMLWGLQSDKTDRTDARFAS